MVHAQEDLIIKSDRQSGTGTENMIFTGDVELTYGPIQIWTEKLQVTRDSAAAVQLIAEGGEEGLAQIKVNSEQDQLDFFAQAKSVTYSQDSGSLLLEGRAKITEGRNDISAEVIKYDIGSGSFSAHKSKNSDQVITKIDLSSNPTTNVDSEDSAE